MVGVHEQGGEDTLPKHNLRTSSVALQLLGLCVCDVTRYRMIVDQSRLGILHQINTVSSIISVMSLRVHMQYYVLVHTPPLCYTIENSSNVM